MNLTTEEIQQILDGAKKFGSFADHYDFDTGQYLPNGTESRLSDLREILELRKQVEELEAQIPKWIGIDQLPKKSGVYLIRKPRSIYLDFACSYFDGKDFDCPHKYISEWCEVTPPEEKDHE